MGDTRTVTITPVGEPTKGKVFAIRVKDIKNQAAGEYYNWDQGNWDAKGAPKVAAGARNLYVAFWAQNQGLDGNLTLQIVEADTGKVLAEKTAFTSGGGVGVEYTGDMPGKTYNLSFKVTP